MNDREKVLHEVLGFLRARCSELLSVIEAGTKFYPAEFRAEAEQFVSSTRAGIALVSNVLESTGPLPGYDDLADEWFDSTGRPCAYGAFDADGHYFAERDQGVDRDCE